MVPNVGPLEIAIVLIISLVVFGPKRIPELGRSLGNGLRGFRRELDGDERQGQQEPVLPSPNQTKSLDE